MPTEIDETSTQSKEVEHDETVGGTTGNPHTGSASEQFVLDNAGGAGYGQTGTTTFNVRF